MYVVVAIAWGDGMEDDSGKRMWSHEFRTRVAAEACMAWVKKMSVGTHVNIFDDFKEEGE